MTGDRVTIVVVAHNSADDLPDCLASIELHGGGVATVVVDNASTDASREVARVGPSVRLIESTENDGFSKANNRGLQTIETEFALVLNPDARLTSSSICELLAAADRHPAGAVIGPRTVYDDGAPQVSFGPDLTLASEWRQGRLVKGVKAGDPRAIKRLRAMTAAEQTVDWVSGSCMLLRMAPARDIGFFDERYFLYEEDADLCLRLRKKGASVVFAPKAVVIHALGTSMAKVSERARSAYDASHRLYYRLHRPRWEQMVLDMMIAVKRSGR